MDIKKHASSFKAGRRPTLSGDHIRTPALQQACVGRRGRFFFFLFGGGGYSTHMLLCRGSDMISTLPRWSKFKSPLAQDMAGKTTILRQAEEPGRPFNNINTDGQLSMEALPSRVEGRKFESPHL